MGRDCARKLRRKVSNRRDSVVPADKEDNEAELPERPPDFINQALVVVVSGERYSCSKTSIEIAETLEQSSTQVILF